jgi:poly-gamma-glutamate synthesis protein (capsule biosynthesis protein)
VIEHNGNKFAFIGCNAKGGGFATASERTPGAVYCDWDWMQSKIADLRVEDYLPIATFQHFEYYTYNAQPNQIRDARRLIEAGAVIVSGSQAHQPQAFEFLDDGFAHHGLGNLFFDQLDVSEATRQGFIDLHVFYNGRHISTELVTIYFVDYARARLMTPQERANMLQAVFSASGW